MLKGSKMKLPEKWKRYFGGLYSSVWSVVLGFAIGSIAITAAGADPIAAYAALIDGAFGSPYKLSETLAKTSPFMLSGLGFAASFKAGFWNVGTEGQILLGAIFAIWGGINFTYLPSILHIPLVCLLGFIAAGVWSMIFGVLKARFGINEIITTLLTNYIIFWLAHYLVHWPWDDPHVHRPQTFPIADSAYFPILIPGTKLHLGIVLGVFCAFLLYLFFKKTVLGYNIRSVGLSPDAARYGGINVVKMIIIATFISGGLSGLGGVGEVSGYHHFLEDYMTEGYGFVGIAAAMLGRNNPLGIILSSLFFGFLWSGSQYMVRGANLPVGVIKFFVGIMILTSLTGPIIEMLKRGLYRVRRKQTG